MEDVSLDSVRSAYTNKRTYMCTLTHSLTHSLHRFRFLMHPTPTCSLSVRGGKGSQFSVGDIVVVTVGELINLTGAVLSVQGSTVTIMPHHEDLHVCVVSCVTSWMIISVGMLFMHIIGDL